MPKNFFEPNVLLNLYYDNSKKLSQRLNIWNSYGTNRLSFVNFLRSILKNQYDVYADLGCGNAYNSAMLLDLIQKKAYMCDLSLNILEDAEKNISNISSALEVSYLNENISNTSIDTKSCDLVTLMHVLHHVDNLTEVFDEVSRIAKDGATIIITTYNHTMKDFLNVSHYDSIHQLGFPEYMKDKSEYLRFSGDNAISIVKKYFHHNKITIHNYENHAVVNNLDAIMGYYTSAMMYRMSEGIHSKDIKPQKWDVLRNRMKILIETELLKNGEILIEGNLTILEVTL